MIVGRQRMLFQVFLELILFVLEAQVMNEEPEENEDEDG